MKNLVTGPDNLNGDRHVGGFDRQAGSSYMLSQREGTIGADLGLGERIRGYWILSARLGRRLTTVKFGLLRTWGAGPAVTVEFVETT